MLVLQSAETWVDTQALCRHWHCGLLSDALQAVILAAAVLAGLRPGVIAAMPAMPNLAAACQGAALRSSDLRSVRVCSIAAAAIANKAGFTGLPHCRPIAVHDCVSPAMVLSLLCSLHAHLMPRELTAYVLP